MNLDHSDLPPYKSGCASSSLIIHFLFRRNCSSLQCYHLLSNFNISANSKLPSYMDEITKNWHFYRRELGQLKTRNLFGYIVKRGNAIKATSILHLIAVLTGKEISLISRDNLYYLTLETCVAFTFSKCRVLPRFS